MNIGILGCGGIALKMATTVNAAKNATLYAVASRKLSKAEDFKNKTNAVKAYGSYTELLNDKDIELVYIATPHNTHYDLIIDCVNHKKPVLCEKSFTTSAVLAKKALDYAEENGVFVTEAIWTRYMPSRLKIDEIIASGIIGEPYLVEANLGYPIYNVPRLTDPLLAGGALLDVGVYTINFADMIFKENPLEINATCTYTKTNVDKTDFINLIYKNDKRAILHATMEGLTSRVGYIYGPLGYIKVTNINNPEQIDVFVSGLSNDKHFEVEEEINGYEYELYESMQMIKEGKLEATSMLHKDTIKIMEFMDEIRTQFGVKYPFEV